MIDVIHAVGKMIRPDGRDWDDERLVKAIIQQMKDTCSRDLQKVSIKESSSLQRQSRQAPPIQGGQSQRTSNHCNREVAAEVGESPDVIVTPSAG